MQNALITQQLEYTLLLVINLNPKIRNELISFKDVSVSTPQGTTKEMIHKFQPEQSL